MQLTGRCLCGAVTYECNTEPKSVTYCHCDTCRRMTGSAFNVGVGVPAEELRVVGEVRGYTATDRPDKPAIREFCPNCGSPLFTRYPKMVFIKAGTLDDSANLIPTRQIWTDLAVPWHRISAGLPSYQQNAPPTPTSDDAR